MRVSWAFPIVVLATVGAAYWVYDSEQKTTAQSEQDLVMVQGALTDLKQIQIQQPGQDLLSLTFDEPTGSWMLKSGPLQEVAAFTEVQKFWDGLVAEKASARLRDAKTHPERFGLSAPVVSELLLHPRQGEVVTWVLGSQKNLAGESYLAVSHSNDVFVASQTWHSLLTPSPFQFRDKRLTARSLADLQAFRVRKGGVVTAEYQLEQGRWIYSKDKDVLLEQNKVRELLKTLGESVVTAIQSENTKLSVPWTTELVFEFKQAPPLEILLGKNKQQEWTAWSSDRQKTLTIAGVDADRLQAVGLDDLQDRKYPFLFQRAMVKKVVTEDLQQNLKNEWKDSDAQATSLLQALSAIEVEQFFTRETEKVTPTHRIQLLGEADEVLLNLDMQVPGKDKNVRVQSSLAEKYFDISPEDFASLNFTPEKAGQ